LGGGGSRAEFPDRGVKSVMRDTSNETPREQRVDQRRRKHLVLHWGAIKR